MHPNTLWYWKRKREIFQNNAVEFSLFNNSFAYPLSFIDTFRSFIKAQLKIGIACNIHKTSNKNISHLWPVPIGTSCFISLKKNAVLLTRYGNTRYIKLSKQNYQNKWKIICENNKNLLFFAIIKKLRKIKQFKLTIVNIAYMWQIYIISNVNWVIIY